jgi:hypothetical protein
MEYCTDTPPPEGIKVDDSNCEDHKLPPLPTPLRKRDPEVDPPLYKDDMSDMKGRIRFKLMLMWFLYTKLRYNPKLELLLSAETEDRESDEYRVKCTIVDIMDELAKILIGTPLLDELKYLYSD